MNITLWTFAAAVAIVLAWALFDRHQLIKRFEKRKAAELALDKRIRDRQFKEVSLENAVEKRATENSDSESGGQWVSKILQTIDQMSDEERSAAYMAHVRVKMPIAEPSVTLGLISPSRMGRSAKTGRFFYLSNLDIARAVVEKTKETVIPFHHKA